MLSLHLSSHSFLFFFNAPATTEIYTLSLHDALPISCKTLQVLDFSCKLVVDRLELGELLHENFVFHFCTFCSLQDRKSTRLNSSHPSISYAVFCLKKKKTTENKENAGK